MATSYRGAGLFNSGPHRVQQQRIGEDVVSLFKLGTPGPGSVAIGPLERRVTVTGRLVAASDAALWSLVDAIAAQLQDPPLTGTLVDHHGRTWADLSFVLFTPEDRTDRGRVVSLGYAAEFVRFLST
ncbi:MAG: hypothetical protein JNM07_13920 [Phycisphaerae bacterium]|nr:hypothetical protein [Phycisphaerae bacterium]